MSEGKGSKDGFVKIEFEVGAFATKFVEAYLNFVGSQKTVGDLAREALFNEICVLRDEVRGL